MSASRLSLLVSALTVACASGSTSQRDAIEDIPVYDQSDSSQGKPPTCTIEKPATNAVLVGVVEVRVKVADPENKGISRVAFGFYAQDSGTIKASEVTKIPPDGTVTTSVDSKVAQTDGNKLFICQVETVDGRKGTATVGVKVDNNPPTVKLATSSTPPYSNVLGDITIRLLVDDGAGVGTARVDIMLNGSLVRQFLNPKNGLQDPVVISSSELLNGKNTIEINAQDLVGNSLAQPLTYWIAFVPPPSFREAPTFNLPSQVQADGIVGLLHSQDFPLLVYGSKGAFLVSLDQSSLKVLRTLSQSQVILATVHDIDGDNLDDIVLVYPEASKFFVQIIKQTGKNQFAMGFKGSVDARPQALSLGDLNRDGIADIALALDVAQKSLGVFISTGADTYQGLKTFGGVENPTYVQIGEFTGDGKNDIVLAKKGSSVVTVFPVVDDSGLPSAGVNTTVKIGDKAALSISFMMKVEPATQGQPDALILADAQLNSMITLTAGTGGNMQVQAEVMPTGISPARVAKGDLDGDGIADMALLCPGSNMVQIYYGTANQRFAEGYSFYGGASTKDITLAYLTGAQSPDIVTLDFAKQALLVLSPDPRSETGRNFVGEHMIRIGDEPLGIGSGRFVKPLQTFPNNKDLAVLLKDPAGEGNVFFIAVDEQTGLPLYKTAWFSAKVQSPVGLIVADLDKNGYDDILVPSQSQGANNTPTMGRLLLREGISHERPALLQRTDPTTGEDVNNGFSPGIAPSVAVVADLKREGTKPGVLDLAVLAKYPHPTQSGQWVLLFQPYVGQGDGTFVIQEGTYYRVPEEKGPSSLYASRLAGTANLDVVMTDYQSNEFTVFYATGLGFFKANEGEAKSYAVGRGPKKVVAEYLDGELGTLDDPLPDLVFLLENDIAIVYASEKVGSEVSYAPPTVLGHQGQGPVDLAVKDINGDGYADIVVLDKQGAVYVYLNLAKRQFSSPFLFPTGLSPQKMTVADLDADGCMDIATADSGGKTVTILQALSCGGK